MKYILGISAYYHDSAAALLENGNIVCAIQEERFTRKKHDNSFPENSIKYILEKFQISLSNIDAVVFYEKPFLKFERLLETYISTSPKGFKSFSKSMPIWIHEKLFQKYNIIKILKQFDENFSEEKIYFSEHHLSHAASTYYPSPYSEAAILTLDGVGEWATTICGIGKNNKIEISNEIDFPHSLGLLYSAFTYYLGFKVNSGEYKLMGLAPYGEPIYSNLIKDNLVDIKEDGTFRLNMNYFDFMSGLKMINDKFEKLFNLPTRASENTNFTKKHLDIASSIQNVLEEIVVKLSKDLFTKYKVNNLCLAGGVALNCVANTRILNESGFKNVWIQPAAGDAGGSLGAALAFWHKHLNKPKIESKSDLMNHSLLGPSFSNKQIKNFFTSNKIDNRYLETDALVDYVAERIKEGKIIGWFQGKMEFGPRALGSRSILADPRDTSMQKKLNMKVKYRESFRPFAPIMLEEDFNKFYDFPTTKGLNYMTFVSKIKKDYQIHKNNSDENLKNNSEDLLMRLSDIRSDLPAITHLDYSSRIQVVNENSKQTIFDLLHSFKKKTGFGVLINTSFNVRGEPIVNSLEDAYKCFLATEIDILVCENFVIEKKEHNQEKFESKNYDPD
ncbi:carbamoyltransferase [Candidatus Pelagibacter sp.]|nr:carbamoyltransferase [Candidatus Pelagibacter sp.]